ncbi:uncharacterized protein LOC132205431 [Neocloeon triangulifer]|uniref:uncharacterized protein LOC132205431 n=1 Tax=Neocloeon triangulifer TaxID=2078957 RepID=UPI00286F3DB6|nr:uncharacterized protein LOC132205431 [Neocloeon triangulifer]
MQNANDNRWAAISPKVAEYIEEENTEALKNLSACGDVERMRDGVSGGNLLHTSIAKRKSKVARFLLESFPSLQYGVDKRGLTPLMYACVHIEQDLDLIRRMAKVDGSLLNKQDTDLQMTALIHLTSKRCPPLKALEILIECGADLNIRDSKGFSALTHALASMQPEELLFTLLRAGAIVEPRDILSQYIRACWWPIVKEILDRKLMDINAEFEGRTLLTQYVWLGMLEEVEYLLEKGANPDVGRGALLEAVKLGCIDTCNLIIKFGADSKKFASSLISEVFKSNSTSLQNLIMNLDGVQACQEFTFMHGTHPQTIALESSSPRLLKFVLDHPYLKNDTLLIDIPDVFNGIELSHFPLNISYTSIIPLVAPLFLPGSNAYACPFFGEPQKTLLDMMMEAKFTAATPDKLTQSPLSMLCQNLRSKYNDVETVALFHKYFNYMINNGADVNQICWHAIPTRYCPGYPEIFLYLKEVLLVPDALLGSFWTLQTGAIVRLLQYWKQPPAALFLGYYQFFNRLREPTINYSRMLTILLHFGIPHGSEVLEKVKKVIAKYMDEESLEYANKIINNYYAQPLSLEKLCIHAIRSNCKVGKGQLLPEALATLPLPIPLLRRLQFKVDEANIVAIDMHLNDFVTGAVPSFHLI